jgi:hypothetical protein
MIDAPSFLLGVPLGALLTIAAILLWDVKRRHQSKYLTYNEVRDEIDAQNVRRIEHWRARKEEAARLSGKGVA